MLRQVVGMENFCPESLFCKIVKNQNKGLKMGKLLDGLNSRSLPWHTLFFLLDDIIQLLKKPQQPDVTLTESSQT